MGSKIYKIKFKGKKFLLIGSKKKGAIATKVQFENFLPSTAHLFPDGKIRRYGVGIGTIKDIKFL